MSWSFFPSKTNEVQFDEKWAFVGKKKKNCDDTDPADSQQGDNWDHVAYDPEHRLVISVIPGKRTAKNVEKLVADFKKRTGGPVRSGPVGCLKCTNGKFSLANPGREVIIIPAKTHSCCAARAASQSRIGEW